MDIVRYFEKDSSSVGAKTSSGEWPIILYGFYSPTKTLAYSPQAKSGILEGLYKAQLD
jgi:hypothetical protein